MKHGLNDNFLMQNLDVATNAIKKDFDMVFAIDGVEGGGKSTIAHQCAAYVDPNLHIDRTVFTPYYFRKAIMLARPGQAVIYDEAYTGLSSRATMSLINRTLISMLAEIRQRNLFVFVVMPTFFDLDKYVALWRSRALIHIYLHENFERGFFSFYNIDRKKDLYINGKKYYSYSKRMAEPNFSGRFTSYFPLDMEEYKKKKRESLVAREKHREEEEVKREFDTQLFHRLMSIDSITHKTKAEILAIGEATYYRRLKHYEEHREES